METYIRNACSLQDIVNFPPYHLHPLIGNRKGEWSIYLGHTGYRVIFFPLDDNEIKLISVDIISECKKIKIIMVTEVSKHYE